MANDVLIQEGHPIDENLRPLKIGGKSSSLELAQTDSGARVRGDLEVTGKIRGTTDIDLIDDLIINGSAVIDRDETTEADGTYRGLLIDFDKTGASSGTNTVKGLDIDLDNIAPTDGFVYQYGATITSTLQAAADSGVYLNYGLYCNTVGSTDGTSVGTGLVVNVSGHDGNNGILVDSDTASDGYDFRTIGSAGDSFSIRCTANGETTLWTKDNSSNEADLHIVVDGDLGIDTETGITKFHKDGDSNDYFMITTLESGVTNITTVDNNDALGHLTFAPDGNFIIDHNYPALYTQIDKDINSSAAATNGAGLWIDYDRIGAVTSGTDVNTGLDLDMNVTGAGTSGTPVVNTVGIDMDIVGDNAGSGASTNTGLDIAISGSDVCNGLIIDTDAGTSVSNGIYLDNKNGGTDFKNVSSADATDYFTINTIAAGATTLATVDTTVGATAHLSIEADGHVEFDNCAVGFDKLAGTWGTSAVIGSLNDGTDIDFRLGNKYELILEDDMGSDDLLNLIFPAVSGNFILVLIHDPTGGHDIHDDAWKAYASDGSLADNTLAENLTDGAVRWAGGATPTLSANGRDIDIISIYWDADEQTALAVASLDFAVV